MPVDHGAFQRGRGNRSRNRFVFRFFAVGALVPAVLLLIGYLASDWSPRGSLAVILPVLAWIVWPTWILMMDAEHAPEIIFMLLIASPLNGVWYSVVGLVIWHVRRLGHGHSGEPPSGDSSPVS